MMRWMILAALWLVACGSDPAAEAPPGAPVVVAAVAVGVVEERIQGSGDLEAKDRAVIAAEVDGQVTELLVEEGQHVAEGDVLLRVDPEKRTLDAQSARAQQREADASAKVAAREFERVRSLHEKGIASDSVLDQRQTESARAQSRLDSARAQLGVAEKLLRDASVRAPFAGYVAQRQVSRGEYVRPGQPLLELVSLDPIEVEFSVAERDSARVGIGQRVAVQVAPYPDESFSGEVSVISPILDPKSRTLRVKARIANADGRLRPGLFARTDLGVARREGALLIPEEAILQRADGEVVFVVGADDLAKRVLVKTGLQRDGKVEIREGLAAEDQVIVRGQAALVDGSKVSRQGSGGGEEQQSLNAAAEPGSGKGTL